MLDHFDPFCISAYDSDHGSYRVMERYDITVFLKVKCDIKKSPCFIDNYNIKSDISNHIVLLFRSLIWKLWMPSKSLQHAGICSS